MGRKTDKNTQQKRLLKRYHTLNDYYANDGETSKGSRMSRNGSTVFNTPTRIRTNTDSFTPYSRIPAIGEKVKGFKNINNRFQLNYHSDNDIHRQKSSRIPVYKNTTDCFNKNVKLTNSSNNINSNNIKLKRSHLTRRNTYVVLEPIVCVKDSDEDLDRRKSLNLTYTKYTGNKKSDIKEKSIVFGQKLFNNTFDSDSDVYASDEMSPSSEKVAKKRETNLNTLNYLLHNLKLSHSTESDLLLPKNNPWLL